VKRHPALKKNHKGGNTMNKLKTIIIVGLVVALPFLGGASGERETKPVKGAAGQSDENKQADQKAGKDTTSSTVKISMDKLVYKPPLRGSPAGRVGGGTRGMTERESFSLQVLAPDHIGFTVHDQPSLYWYVSKPIPHPIELTVIERNAVEPLIEKVVKGPERGGIQAIRLADYGLHLRRNVPYKWFVTLVTDPDHRSKDIMAGGIITLVEPPPSLLAKLKVAGNNNAPYVYAEEGLWYDALEAISRMIDGSPTNADFRKQRVSLLGQVGLSEVAEFEKRQ
jgi:hypothetical protein